MKVLTRIALAGLLTLNALVIVMNAQYLYTTPIANTWVWWRGDETWLMAQYHHFLSTGHYLNPLAPGSVFSQSSGLLFGSCLLTAALYGLPLLFLKSHTIDAGRTITLIFAILTLFSLWLIAKRYRVSPVLRAYGCLLLASSLCFFITSHSARPDVLIGMTIMIFTGILPLMAEKNNINKAVLLGSLLPFCFLVNGHVLIVSFLTLCYSIFAAGVLRNRKYFIRMACAAIGGFAFLLILEWVLLGSASLLGPFSGASNSMPVVMLLHPKYDLGNLNWRYFIANAWAPGVLWVSVVLAAALLWARIRFHIRLSQMDSAERRLVICSALAVVSSILFDYYWPRYFIYVLPSIVLSFVIVISYLARTLPRASVSVLAAALTSCMVYAVLLYGINAHTMGTAGQAITSANKNAVTEALAAIHSHNLGKNNHSNPPRVFSTIPGQYIAMDDSCELLTPVIFDHPIDTTISNSERWKRARIDYAIVCNPAYNYDWIQTDSIIDWQARSRSKIIFESIGLFSDIGRSYDPPGLKKLDTLRVYEFE